LSEKNFCESMILLCAMASKSRRNFRREKDVEIQERSVSTEALRGVAAILLIAIAGFLILSEVGGGGVLGEAVFAGLSWLLGVGYTLLPLSLFLTAILIFKSFERKFGWVQLSSMGVFLL